jgi:hypothetical protein
LDKHRRAKSMHLLKPIPASGDIIYVNRGLYKHYGIYAGDGKVIHFAPYSDGEISAENAVIHETTLEAFLKGGKLEIDKKAKAKFSQKETVMRARTQIGGKGYNLTFNNCEHFARWCKTGHAESEQVNQVIDIVAEGIKCGVDMIEGIQNSKKTKKVEKKILDYLR